MREPVRKELRAARLHVSVGATSEAERHIRVALKLIDGAPEGSFSRKIRACALEAGFAIAQSDSRLAAAAIDEALLALDEEPESTGDE